MARDIREKMRTDWDQRARENHRHYIVNSRTEWRDEDFESSGEETAEHYIDTDLGNICQGKSSAGMRVLDFGCGSGRVTRALARRFGHVVGVDISAEMLAIARRELAGVANIEFFQSNGSDLGVLGGAQFDFAFSFSVFHHVPDKEVIETCIREVGAHLKKDALFKFEVQGYLGINAAADDTWLGAGLSEAEMAGIAERSGFEYRYNVGAGEENYWQWLFKK